MNIVLPADARADALVQAANEHQRHGRLAEAETLIRQALARKPNHADALHSLGLIAHQCGDFENAVDLIRRALAGHQNYHQAENNLGNALLALGRIDEAIAAYERAVAIKPDYAQALFNLGIVHERKHDDPGAKIYFNRCIAANSRHADAHYRLGLLRQREGDRTGAQIAYSVAVEINPGHVEARRNLATLLTTVGRLSEAADHYQMALEATPNDARLHHLLGVALRKDGRLKEAIAAFEKCLELAPTNADYIAALASTYQSLGDIDRASELYLKAIEIDPDLESAVRSYLFLILNQPGLTSDELFEKHRRLRSRHDKPEVRGKEFADRNRDPHRRLKVGYLSSDFRTHVVSLNLLPLMAEHAHDGFEVFLYAEVPFGDQITDMFRGYADHYVPTAGKSDAEVAQMIETDEIDILVVVAGRFDENRPLVASYRPAPVQVSFHDCATSGLEAMDYWLTDGFLHPPDTEERFTEELYRLPVFYQYPLFNELPDVVSQPCLDNGYVTFGSFNKPEKINDEVVELWAEILGAVPNSRLLLKYFNYYSDGGLAGAWQAKFERLGVGPERLILRATAESRNAHLRMVSGIDIALDPFPFNGATTTYEALSMGVPVVTLIGRHFVDRVGASLVTHAGYSQFAAPTKVDYVEIARHLAADGAALQELRSGMRDRLSSSPICDGRTYSRNVEAAYRDMWVRWCEGQGPTLT